MASRSGSNPFPGFSHIYELDESGGSRAFRASLDLTGEEVDSLLEGERKRDSPIRGQWAMGGSKPKDIIWTTWATPVLLSERVVGVLRDGGFTGWDVVPVELRGKQGEPLPTYYFLCLRGRCGPPDYSRSTKIDRIMPARISPVWIGLYFDPATWDGTDVFLATGTGFMFVVEGVKRAFKKAKVRNVVFTPLDEVELTGLDL